MERQRLCSQAITKLNQANLVLNLAKLTDTKKMVMPVKTKTSRQMLSKSSPFIITFLTMIKYHLDGMTFEINCIGKGKFSNGNMNPLN